jgi:hypothetical protein
LRKKFLLRGGFELGIIFYDMRTRELANTLWQLGKLSEKLSLDGEFDRAAGVEAAVRFIAEASAESRRARERRRRARAEKRMAGQTR